ncbi:hsp30p [Saccharomyces arboricola H-6]|uniref:Hsp30p n=1 Tax=Saccharomyces arboricola (strain H-6 / AS 2.3317 / CBS 10644) TaxID=1160507 RepID=J8PQU5_SACAR|nr:hsp30p [Saccharomyces arboricola H-6]
MNGTLSSFLKRNEALGLNPPHGLDMHITKRGSDWLWAVFAVFAFVLLCYIIMFFIAENKSSRVTRYALAPAFLIAFFEFFAFFTYASDLGWTGVQAEFNHVKVDKSITGDVPGVRQIFYSKYIAWFLSWPCLLFLIELTASITGKTEEGISALDMIHSLLIQIVGTLFWVVSLLVGSLIKSTYKWGYFTIGAIAMLVTQGVVCQRQFFNLKTRGFNALMLCTSMVIVWLYFICWGLSDGGNRIQPDGEAIFYGVLDLCMFAIYPCYLVITVSRTDKSPKFSWTSGFSHYHHAKDDVEDEIPETKEAAPESPRASGETAIHAPEPESEQAVEATA